MEPVRPGHEARARVALTDHLLVEILIRIGAPADLARAAAACEAFRRLITDPAFLRRYLSLHRPLLLGFVGPMSALGLLPAEAPHPNAPAALAFAGAADFTFRHLPDLGRDVWTFCDGCIHLLPFDLDPEGGLVLPELAVYASLTQGYTQLPPIPDGLLASVLLQVQDENID